MINRVKKKKKTEEIVGDLRVAEGLRKIGFAWGGNWWLSDMAREIEYSKSLLSRILDCTRTIDPDLLVGVRDAVITKLENLGKALGSPVLPGHTDPKTKRAQKLIAQACKLLDQVEVETEKEKS